MEIRSDANAWIFTQDLQSTNWEDMLCKIRLLIANIFSTHSYIHGSLDEHEKVHFNRILNADPTYPHLTSTLQELSRYLTRFHQERCIVLVDEYDAPLDSAYNAGYYDEAKSFFGVMFSSLLKVSSPTLS